MRKRLHKRVQQRLLDDRMQSHDAHGNDYTAAQEDDSDDNVDVERLAFKDIDDFLALEIEKGHVAVAIKAFEDKALRRAFSHFKRRDRKYLDDGTLPLGPEKSMDPYEPSTAWEPNMEKCMRKQELISHKPHPVSFLEVITCGVCW